MYTRTVKLGMIIYLFTEKKFVVSKIISMSDMIYKTHIFFTSTSLNPPEIQPDK